jgi:hypothetical protein
VPEQQSARKIQSVVRGKMARNAIPRNNITGAGERIPKRYLHTPHAGVHYNARTLAQWLIDHNTYPNSRRPVPPQIKNEIMKQAGRLKKKITHEEIKHLLQELFRTHPVPQEYKNERMNGARYPGTNSIKVQFYDDMNLGNHLNRTRISNINKMITVDWLLPKLFLEIEDEGYDNENATQKLQALMFRAARSAYMGPGVAPGL